MKISRIILLLIIGSALLYVPISMLFSTAQAAEEPVDPFVVPAEKDVTEDSSSSGLAPNVHTPDSYIPPQYDPFSNKHRPDEAFYEKVEDVVEGANTPPLADFTIRTESGVADQQSGTTATEFRFSAHATRDKETRSGDMKVRWDFESDGVWDTYFSRSKNTRHIFEEAGTYVVTLEVLDGGGLLDQATKEVVVVENTEPFGFFEFSPLTGTTKQVFTFDVGDSDDSQYKGSALEYRFDWDGDGRFDTPFDTKNIWRHVFETAGTHYVVMEVRDPEGASSFAEATIEVFDNQPPKASFFIDVKTQQVTKDVVRNKYFFDASDSVDPEGEKLQYRWDFNYTGENDISFTTGWSSSSKYSGVYDFPGSKVVRLQVRDKDGAVDEAFASVLVQ